MELSSVGKDKLPEPIFVSAHKKASTADMTLLECDEQCVEAISPLALCEPHRKTRCLPIGSIRNCGSGGQERLNLLLSTATDHRGQHGRYWRRARARGSSH